MEAVLTLMPEDERVQYSALTGQSLFYMGETNLKHKILAIAEEEGASNASYALKLLQSEGVITIASTGKDDATGQLVTKEYRVEGPVMLFLTTTAIDIDEELLNRCMVLTVNESRDQTRAIHEMQRQRQTLEGMFADMDRSDVLLRHRTAQRLLRSIKVVNPYAGDLGFADGQTRTRRDHMKYLGLISAIALLHQHSRAVKRVEHQGRVIEYVEVIPKDIELANRLASVVLGRTLDELPPQTRKLLIALQDWVTGRADTEDVPLRDIRFRRREARDELGWSDTPLKVHLSRLVEMEYLVLHRTSGLGGTAFEYQLAHEGAAGGALDLRLPVLRTGPDSDLP
jgi:DNA primase